MREKEKVVGECAITEKSILQLVWGLIWCSRIPPLSNAVVPFLLIKPLILF